MTVSTLTKAAAYAAPLAILVAMAAPVSAGTTQDQIEQCKVQTLDAGGITTETHELNFKTATKKKIILEVRPLDGSDSYTAVCRLRGGKVKVAEIKLPNGEVMVAQK